MAVYPYYCPRCDHSEEVTKPMGDSEVEEFCPACLAVMERDYRSCCTNVGGAAYAKPIISESLGIHPEQAAEHREKFPNIEVMPEGQLKFDNFKDHSSYLNKIGWDKKELKRIRKSR